MDALRRENLERLVSWKLSSELKIFQCRMLSGTKEDIYKSAFEIDAKIQLYEAGIMLVPVLSNQNLQKCIEKSSLLEFLYQTWMHTPDSQSEEINKMVLKSLEKLELNIA